MNQPIHNDYWLSRFESILNSALVQHRAVSLIRVDLRFPEHMPVTIMDPDPDSAVISRFFESLKARNASSFPEFKTRAEHYMSGSGSASERVGNSEQEKSSPLQRTKDAIRRCRVFFTLAK